MGGLRDPSKGQINVIQKVSEESTSSISKVSEPDWKTAGLLWETMQVIYSGLAGISFLLLITVGSWGMQKPISELTEPSHGWSAWVCVCFGFPVALWGFRYNSFLMGTNHVALFRRYETLVNLVACLALIVFLIWSPNLLSMTLVFYTVQIFGVWVNHRLSLRINNGIISSFSNWKIDKQVIATVWPVAWRSFLGVFFFNGTMEFDGFHLCAVCQGCRCVNLSFFSTVSYWNWSILPISFLLQNTYNGQVEISRKTKEIVRIAQRGMRYTYVSYVLLASIAGWMLWGATKLSHGNDLFPRIDYFSGFSSGRQFLQRDSVRCIFNCLVHQHNRVAYC